MAGLDPLNIRPDNFCQALTAISERQGELVRHFGDCRRETNDRLDTLDNKITDLNDIVAPLRFSRCSLIPWIARNKVVMTVTMSIISAWIAAIMLAVQIIQAALPPGLRP
jgi:hypothetical protein